MIFDSHQHPPLEVFPHWLMVPEIICTWHGGMHILCIGSGPYTQEVVCDEHVYEDFDK